MEETRHKEKKFPQVSYVLVFEDQESFEPYQEDGIVYTPCKIGGIKSTDI